MLPQVARANGTRDDKSVPAYANSKEPRARKSFSSRVHIRMSSRWRRHGRRPRVQWRAIHPDMYCSYIHARELRVDMPGAPPGGMPALSQVDMFCLLNWRMHAPGSRKCRTLGPATLQMADRHDMLQSCYHHNKPSVRRAPSACSHWPQHRPHRHLCPLKGRMVRMGPHGPHKPCHATWRIAPVQTCSIGAKHRLFLETSHELHMLQNLSATA